MLRWLRNILIVVAVAAGLGALVLFRAKPAGPAPVFDGDEAYAAIRELSSSRYGGRLTGSPGNQAAMDWIAGRFRALGLQPFAGSGTYVLPFEAYVPELTSTPELEIRWPGGAVRRYRQYADFRETYAGHARPGEALGRAYAAASTRTAGAPGASILLYDNPDPQSLEEGPLLADGIKGVILRDEDRVVALKPGGIWTHAFDDPRGFVKFYVRKAVMEELKAAAAAGAALRMRIAFSMRWVRTGNVAGLLPAADGRTDDVEVISCHLDHLGRTLDGGFYPGALDNASGTGAMLALARTLAGRRSQLAKAFVFVAFNAEEQYLGGSSRMVRRPPLSPARAEVLNFDMVGSRREVPLELDSMAVSAREDPSDPIVGPMEARIQELAARRGVKVVLNRQAQSSDHLPFAFHRIPAVTFCHAAEGDYHTVHDELDNIDRRRLAAVGQVALDYLSETAFVRPLRRTASILGFLALAAGLGAAALALRRSGAAEPRTRRSAWLSLSTGAAAFVLVLLFQAGAPRCARPREAARVAEGARDSQTMLSENRTRPFPSPENEAVADYIAERFRASGLKPYRRNPQAGTESYFLESRAMLPEQTSAPVLQLLSPGGAVLRSYTRGRDFRETTEGHGGGGSAEGPFRTVTTAYTLRDSGCAIACIRKADYHPLDDANFARWGAKAVLVEGDPALAPPPDYGDDKDAQLQGEGTFLKFIVSSATLRELAEAEAHGARLRAAWGLRFAWAYPRSVIGCVPGSETGRDSELLIAVPLDTPRNAPDSGRALALFLGLAEAMAGTHPKHAIVFMAANGTHAGQLGLKAYLDAPMDFKPSRKGSWLGDEEPDYGLVGERLAEADRTRGSYATGRHVLLLEEGREATAVVYTGSESAFFVQPGERLARSLEAQARAFGLPLAVSLRAAGLGHEGFAERWNPAATYALPAAPDSDRATGAALARFIRADAVAVAPTPLAWAARVGKALAAAGIASLAAAWAARHHRARKPRPVDAFDAFLRRPAGDASHDGPDSGR